MDKRRRRRKSVILFIAGAILVGFVTGIVSTTGQPESVNAYWAAATLDARGNATVQETIEYHFNESRHGIYRVLPDVPLAAADQIDVSSSTSDQTKVLPDGSGVKLKIGDPNKKVSGDHRYEIIYPLTTLELGGDRFGWDGVGADWDVPIERTELDLVAPWDWRNPSCDVGTTGSFTACTVTQPEPGHLVVSYGHLDSGEGITLYARRGARVAHAPAPRTPQPYVNAQPWWQKPLVIGLGAGILLLWAAFIYAWRLRRAGRDWVMAGAASTDSAAAAAFSTTAGTAGAIRVDDTRLEEWTTTEFVPPKGISAWKGGVLVAEKPKPEHKVAWLLGTAIDGYIDLDDTDPDAMVISEKDHAPDETTELLEVAFAGRDRVELGKYDKDFAALWSSLGKQQKTWFETSAFADPTGERKASSAVKGGIVGIVFAMMLLQISAHGVYSHGLLAMIGVGIGALALGACLALLLRGWELHVRTPAGSAMWLRVASFRRFLHNSEAEHVRQAAERGVLREYTAWAVALDEADHWSAAAEAAGLPPTTTGLGTAMAASTLSTAVSSTGTSSSSGGGGGGVGGGGGGGGGGSW